MHAKAAPARPEHALIHSLPIGGELDRVAANQNFGHVAAPQMRGPHLEEALHDLGRCIGLADSKLPVFIEDLNDDRLGGAVEVVGGLHRRREWDHLQPPDVCHPFAAPLSPKSWTV